MAPGGVEPPVQVARLKLPTGTLQTGLLSLIRTSRRGSRCRASVRGGLAVRVRAGFQTAGSVHAAARGYSWVSKPLRSMWSRGILHDGK